MAAKGPGNVKKLADLFNKNDSSLKTATGFKENDTSADVGLGLGPVTNGPLTHDYQVTHDYQAPRLPTAQELGMTDEEYANQVAAMAVFQMP